MRILQCLALLCLGVVASCQSVFGPGDKSGHPLEGTWDVTTQLTQFSFETAAPSPPDCPGAFLYCTHLRTFGGATLSGVLEITLDGRNAEPLAGAGIFAGEFCDTWDVSSASGCTHVSPLTGDYRPSSSSLSGFAADSSFFLGLQTSLNATYSNGPAIYLNGRLVADSLVGDVRWMKYLYRSPPTHIGTFIARRRK